MKKPAPTTNQSLKFFIRTYGCQMNVHESEKLKAQLTAKGFEKTNSEKTAEIIVFNTCCIRNTAEQKIISHIGETKHSKKIICLVGCLSQRLGTAETLKKKFPHLAIILGTHNIQRLPSKLQEYINTKKSQTEIQTESTDPDSPTTTIIKSPDTPTKNYANSAKTKANSTGLYSSTHDHDTPTAKSQSAPCTLHEKVSDSNSLHHENSANTSNIAYINITYGCENYCTFCIVPSVRGNLITRDSALIEQELNDRIKSSPDTIMLLGQNVNSYICPRTGKDFPALLGTLCAKIPDNCNTKINFMSSHPKDFSTSLIDIIAANPKIERNIHLPLQSGSDRILALMNRKYTTAEYETKINLLRARVPNIHITTDIICGFPSETENDFAQTCETMKRIKFNAAFIFPYSRRTGTKADTMPNQIDSKTKKSRTTALIAIQREISKTITTTRN